VVRMRKLLVALGGLLLAVGLLTVGTVALTSGPAFAKTASGCPEGNQCGGISSSSGSSPPGGSVTLTGHGYTPGTVVTIDVCGLETLTVLANSSGNFTITIKIPNSATPGSTCVITATGKGSNGQSLTTSTSVVVTSGSSVPPVGTGEPWSASLYWVLTGLVAAFGLTFLEVGRRRRRGHLLS
jgi:hypothetical protein